MGYNRKSTFLLAPQGLIERMDVFDTYPKAVNPVLFEEAYLLHKAASETYRQQNKSPSAGRSPEQTSQRNSILEIAAQLLVLERNKLLDRFCVDWLCFRDIPLPEKAYESTRSMDGECATGTNGSVQSSVRSNEIGTQPTNNRIP